MYFVLTREEDALKEPYGGTWGYYSNPEAAVDAVHRNVTDPEGYGLEEEHVQKALELLNRPVKIK